MRVGSLFSGIGGFDLAARWVGWETAWYSEIEPYACGVMARHFPDAINHGDITQIRGADVAPVDLLCGGFPCQDISLAGKGAGIGGARSGLWGEFARLIGEIHPRWVVAENVSALRSRGLVTVLQDLDALGYDAEWHCIPASAVGAPHQRDRIWIVAHPKGNGWGEERPDAGGGREGSRAEGDCGSRPPLGGPHDPRGPQDRISMGDPDGEPLHLGLGSGGQEGSGASPSPRPVDPVDPGLRNTPRGRDSDPRRPSPDPDGRRHGDPVEAVRPGRHGSLDGGDSRASLPDGLRDRPSDGRDPRWWALEPNVGRVVDGFSSPLDRAIAVDRLRCLGNAIVPQVAYRIFSAIALADASLTPPRP